VIDNGQVSEGRSNATQQANPQSASVVQKENFRLCQEYMVNNPPSNAEDSVSLHRMVRVKSLLEELMDRIHGDQDNSLTPSSLLQALSKSRTLFQSLTDVK
jgi:type VI protein secretion system component VasK